MLLHVKGVGLLRELVHRESFPRLLNLSVDLEECTEAASIMLCNELREFTFDEDIEGDARRHFSHVD